MTDVEKAIEVLKKAVHEDSDYAWGWQCNLAMSFHDEGISKKKANLGAARFMNLLFDIDMTKHERFPYTQITKRST